MIKPKAAETQELFVKRFMQDSNILSTFPNQAERFELANSVWENKELVNMSVDGWYQPRTCRFIEPGLVFYQALNQGKGATLLVRKPALDNMAKTMIGKPIVNVIHRKVNPQDFQRGNADGIVTKVWYEALDGWYHAEFIPFNAETDENCSNGKYYVSCSYLPTDVDETPGYHHDVPYNGEIKDGKYTHLAIVNSPRYEGAYITNSKEGSHMKLKFWKKSKDAEGKEVMNASDADEGALVEIEGKQVPLKDLVALHNASNPEALADDAEVELGNGKKVSVADLKATYLKNSKEKKNSDDKKDDEDESDDEKKNAKEMKCAEDKKKKEDEEKENAKEMKCAEDKKKKDEEERENSKHFEEVKNAKDKNGGAFTPPVMSRVEKMQRGNDRYGAIKTK